MSIDSLDATTERARARTKSVTWSALAGLASSGAIAVVSLFSAPITINYLGKELYAIWIIISAFLVWARLFDFGILNGLTNALTEALGRDDYASARSYVCTSVLITSVIGFLGLFVWMWASLHVPWHAFIRVDTLEQSILLSKGIGIVGAIFLFSLPFLLVMHILQAYQKGYLTHIIHFILYLLTLVGLLVGIYWKADLLQLLFLVSALPTVWYVICFFCLLKQVPWTRFSWKYVNMRALKRVSHSSAQLLVLQIVNVLTSQMAPLLIASVSTLRDVADFSILWKIYLFVFFMMSTISSAHNPSIRDAFERKEIAWIKRALKRLVFLQVGMILIGCCPLLFFGNTIIERWIRMPLEQPLATSGWCVFIACILFCVLQGTLNGILLILDKIVLQIVLVFASSIVLFFGIRWGVPQWGLMIIFAIMTFTSFVSILFSFRALKKTVF